jgi:NagD protein
MVEQDNNSLESTPKLPKGIVFDMDGVLRIGPHPISNANEVIQTLHKKHVKGIISTNECRFTDSELRDDLSEIGINIPESWPIYTSGMAVRDFLKSKIVSQPEKNYSLGIIGERGLIETINELTQYSNCEICDVPPKYETKLILIVGCLNKIKISNLEKGLTWAKANAKIITSMPDNSDPSSKGDFNLCVPNHILHLLKYNISIPKSYSLGKPHPIHVKKIRETFKNIDSSDMLFVGDTLYTDIQLAEEHDIPSCLVLTGNSNNQTLKNYIIEPTIILKSVKELLSYYNLKELQSP